MNKIYFRFKSHPGDFLRNSEITEMPNPDENLEEFLIWFLENYQSDKRIAHINDLSKLIDNEFSDENDKANFLKIIGIKTENELISEIEIVENELKTEAYKNFYNLVLTNKIEILNINERK